MPDMLRFPDGKTRPVATHIELLEFVNRGRKAGAANLLPELLPSDPGNSSQCLIANALNFGCSVDGHGDNWWMQLPVGMGTDRVDAIAEALGCERVDGCIHRLRLPKHIGNAALAFDRGVAFQDLVVD